METLRQMYVEDKDFSAPWYQCINRSPTNDYTLNQRNLFKGINYV